MKARLRFCVRIIGNQQLLYNKGTPYLRRFTFLLLTHNNLILHLPPGTTWDYFSSDFTV